MRLEHANLSVLDADAMTHFISTAFPEFAERGRGHDNRGRPWRHIGDSEFYIALQTVPPSTVRVPYGDTPGMNHLGWEIDNVDALEVRMNAAGFEANLRVNGHPARRRIYFYDPDGNDWEFVQYLTPDRTKRHEYELA